MGTHSVPSYPRYVLLTGRRDSNIKEFEYKYDHDIPLSEEVKIRTRVAQRGAKAHWGEYLEEIGPWEVFLTQTFPWKCGQPLVEDYVKTLFEVMGPTQAFVVSERARGSVGPHVHALLGDLSLDVPGGRNTLLGLRKYSSQRWGRCQIDEFVPALGASHYVTKEMGNVEYAPVYAWGIGEKKMCRKEIHARLERDGAAAFRM